MSHQVLGATGRKNVSSIAAATPSPAMNSGQPNDLWCADYKG
jgi:hypothetical protein